MLHENDYLAWLAWLIFCLIGGLLAQTYLLPYWVGLGAAVIGWQFRFGHKAPNHQLSWPVLIGSSLMLIGLVANIWLSQNQFITIAEAMKWILVILVWWAAMLRPPAENNKALIWLGGLVLVIVVGTISLATWILPGLRFLPEMNFLYATFGHNHWSIWLLISLPWIGLADRVWPSHWWKWLMGGWLVWLLSTFGRWAIGVSLIELILLWSWLRHDRSWDVWLKSCFGVGLVLLISLLNWSNWLSITNGCPRFIQKFPQLCKSIQSERRPEYWRQAIEGITTKPLFGYGLGTFNYLSLAERLTPSGYSGYVHNDYLQWMVEAGWWGWLISLGLWWNWWRYRPVKLFMAIKSSGQVGLWFNRAIWLSVGAILVNSLIDFDLHFVAVMVFLVMSLGWLKAEQEVDLRVTKNQFITKSNQPPIQLIQRRLQNWLMGFLILLCLVWAGYFGLTNYWWQHGQRQLVWQQPYYFPAHSFWLMQEFSSATASQQTRVFQMWLTQPDSLEDLLIENFNQISSSQRIMVLEKLYQLNPWSRINQDLIEAYLQVANFSAAQKTLIATDDFFQHQTRLGANLGSISDETRWRIAKQSTYLAGIAFKNGNLTLGLDNLEIAKRYELWSLSENQANYGWQLETWLKNQSSLTLAQVQSLEKIFEMTSQLEPKYFGFSQTNLAKVALIRLEQKLQKSDCGQASCERLKHYALRITESAEWVKRDLSKFRSQFPHEQQLESI